MRRGSLSSEDVRAEASTAAFGQKLITNNLRGLIAEVIVGSALPPEWKWCSADWAGWDFERADGLKLEVKQSAARQTWTGNNVARPTCRFDIKPRKGSYVGADWQPMVGRQAQIYVFAHHFEGGECADHCEPSQWRFFVVPESRLPPSAQTIGLGAIEKLAARCTISELLSAVQTCAKGLSSERWDSVRSQPGG
jgi:hypothetical protein